MQLELKVKQNESDHYAEEIVQLETEKKTLTDEVVSYLYLNLKCLHRMCKSRNLKLNIIKFFN